MIERVDQAAVLQQAAQTSAVKLEQAVSEAAQKVDTATEITLRYPTDRVEISEQGYARLAQQSSGATDTATASAGGKTEDPALASAKRAIEQPETSDETAETAAAESATDSSTNLTSLTEQQLEDLVKEGTITRAQADSELARRQGTAE